MPPFENDVRQVRDLLSSTVDFTGILEGVGSRRSRRRVRRRIEAGMLAVVLAATGTGTAYLLAHRLRPHTVRPAASTPTGTIVFASNEPGSGDPSDIYVMNADGSNVRELTADSPNPTATEYMPDWSPDGTKIAFAGNVAGGDNVDIYVMNADGTNISRLTDDPGIDADPDWSPDGMKIAFRHDEDRGGHLYVMNADGSNLHRIMVETDNQVAPDWSPDGNRIAFSGSVDGTWDVFTVSPDGNNISQLTETGDANAPAWSPDGSRIAFVEDSDIYVMNADGSGRKPLVIGAIDEFAPTWSPDGNYVVFTLFKRPTREQPEVERGYRIAISPADGGNLEILIATSVFPGPSWKSS